MPTDRAPVTRSRGGKQGDQMPSVLEGEVGNRQHSYKATISPERAKHRAEQLAKMARDFAEKEDEEKKQQQLSGQLRESQPGGGEP